MQSRCTANLFLDKAMTKRTCTVMIDPDYAPLPLRERQRRITYAISDCFAVTYLHRPISEQWPLSKLYHESNLTSLFTSMDPPLPPLSMVLEEISDGEMVGTHQVIDSLSPDYGHNQQQVDPTQIIEHFCPIDSAGNAIYLTSSNFNQPYTEQPRPCRTVRSIKGRTHRNRKRNIFLLPLRDRHVLIRPLYHPFTMK
jgi:hypothetical protein